MSDLQEGEISSEYDGNGGFGNFTMEVDLHAVTGMRSEKPFK